MRATALIGVLALLWGSGFFWIKLLLEGLTPVQLTFARLALGALVLVPIVVIRRLPRPRGRALWGHLVVSALVANAIPYTLFAIAEQTVASSLAGVINGTTPLWAILIAVAARADTRLTPRRGLGVLVVFEPWNATTGAPLVINFTLIGTEGPTAASIVTYLIPAVALALGIFILGEPARLTLPLGALLILIGVALVRPPLTSVSRSCS